MKNRTGFTLIELLVAVGLASMVFILTSSVLMTVITANSKSQRQEAFEQTKNDVGMDLSNAIRWAKDVKVQNKKVIADANIYEIKNGRILKNDEAITTENVDIEDWTIEDFTNTDGWVSLEINIEMASKVDALSHDSLRFVVSQRKLETGL